MEDVLGLLPVSSSLLECFDDEGSGAGQNSDLALSVLDGDFNLDLDSLPLGSGLLDVLTDFLGVETHNTTLGGKSCCTGDFSSNAFHE